MDDLFRRLRSIAFLAAAIALSGCPRYAYSPAVPGVSAPVPAASTPAVTKLMIFGGANHTVYLGCLNCSEYAADSVNNAYGTHGSAYSTESVHNHYSEYGSPYSNESACSEYATDPPVIVDQGGRFYGRLTLNHYNAQIGEGVRFVAWLAAVCNS